MLDPAQVMTSRASGGLACTGCPSRDGLSWNEYWKEYWAYWTPWMQKETREDFFMEILESAGTS